MIQNSWKLSFYKSGKLAVSTYLYINKTHMYIMYINILF